jgi:hypothetical protein
MFIKKHKILTTGSALLIILIVWMALTRTLAYPYIMLDRQAELIDRCAFGLNSFSADRYGYSFSVPEGYCILPDRLFPTDGSIEIVPRGWYFVFNEYAKGTIAEGAKATLLFEPLTTDRNPNTIIHNLIAGKFLDETHISNTINPASIGFTLADSVLGTDNQLYNWAFATRPDKKYFLAIITKQVDDQTVGQYVLQNTHLN